MTQYTRLHAANLLLAALGNPSADGQAALWLAGWSSREIGCGVGCNAPQNNLWATTLYEPGATDFNSAHVRNYPSLSMGISAAALTLHNGLYPHLLSALQANNIAALTDGSVQPDLATWCGSICYSEQSAQFIADGEAHKNDLFDDTQGGATSTTTGTAPDAAIGSCKACLTGLPLGCPTDEQCVTLTDSGQLAPGALSLAGVCVANSYANTVGFGKTTAADSIVVCQRIKSGSLPAPATNSGLSTLLPTWITTPDWSRVLKFVLGLVAIGFGLLLAFSLISKDPTVQSVAKVAALA